MRVALRVYAIVLSLCTAGTAQPCGAQIRVEGVDSVLATVDGKQKLEVRFVGAPRRERVRSFTRNPSTLQIPTRARPATLAVDSMWSLRPHSYQRGAVVGGLAGALVFGVVGGVLSCYEGCSSGPAAGAAGGVLFGGLLGGVAGGLIGGSGANSQLVFARPGR